MRLQFSTVFPHFSAIFPEFSSNSLQFLAIGFGSSVTAIPRLHGGQSRTSTFPHTQTYSGSRHL